MHEEAVLRIPGPPVAMKPAVVQAEPHPLEIDLERTAVIVVDMTNSSVAKGGYADLMGWERTPKNIEQRIKKINSAARRKGVKVIYIAHQYSPDLREGGGPNSPNWYKDPNLVLFRERPESRDKMGISGTWGAQIMDELKPQEGDIIVEKQRYSGFVGTNLDVILKGLNIKYLIFTGVGTNICVEGSLRDAYYRDYFCILASDATATGGPPFVHDATIFSVKQSYGWVATSDNIIRAME